MTNGNPCHEGPPRLRAKAEQLLFLADSGASQEAFNERLFCGPEFAAHEVFTFCSQSKQSQILTNRPIVMLEINFLGATAMCELL